MRRAQLLALAAALLLVGAQAQAAPKVRA